jgi:hypothetical protein
MKVARVFAALALCAAASTGYGTAKTTVRTPSEAQEVRPTSGTQSTTTTTSTTEFGVTVDDVGAIRNDYFDPGTGISLTVPSADAAPTVTWQQAVTQCFLRAGICDRTAGTVRVSLAVGYNPLSDDALPNESIKPTMSHDLVYVLAQPLRPCLLVGPSRPSPLRSVYPSCMSLSFIDAHSGKGATSVSGPTISDPSSP